MSRGDCLPQNNLHTGEKKEKGLGVTLPLFTIYLNLGSSWTLLHIGLGGCMKVLMLLAPSVCTGLNTVAENICGDFLYVEIL